MKKLIQFAAMFMMALAFGSFAISCDSEDHDPNDVKSINAEYSLDLSQTWFDFYDITVDYLDEYGKECSENVTGKWNYGFSVSPKKAPRNYVFTVTATPKKQLPEFNETTYILAENIEGRFYGIRYDGTVYKELWSSLHPYSLTATDTYTFNAEQMKNFVIDGGTRKLMQFATSFDGNY